MSNFQLYSEYYNLFYQDKNYAEEVDYIEKFIKEYSINPQSILDLGCGSGRHDYEFFKKGYQVTGVDLSQSMLELTKDLPGNNIEFFHGDVRTIDLKKKFDVVISLFHILSYQQTNDDVIAFFETVKKHLKPEGIFICDCWYGPGVLNDPPVIRIKEFETNYKSILRIASPTLNYSLNTVDVNYKLFVRDKISSLTKEINELHQMRYFSIPELDLFSKYNNLHIIEYYKWLTTTNPDFKTWNLCFVGKIR